VLLILQLAHLKHFDEPLTAFVRDGQLDAPIAELAPKKLSDPKAAAFVSSLFSWSFGPQKLASNEEGWPVNDVAGLLASIAEARTDFCSHLRRLKLAFGMMRKVYEVILDLGYRVTGTEMTSLEMMSASLKGGLAREGKHLGTITRSVPLYHTEPESVFLNSRAGVHRKLSGEKLSILLGELRSFLDELPDHLDEVHEAQQCVTTTAALLEDDKESADGAQIADEFGDWLIGYFQLVFLPATTSIMLMHKV
jgi:origin recognition complex subunit 3